MSNPIILVVDGVIGAGKSVLVEKIATSLRIHPYNKKVVVITEPVDKWEAIGIFQKFCKDMKRWAYEFQTYVHFTRVQSCINGFNTNADIYILERSYYTDKYIFIELLKDNGCLSDMQYEMYNNWWELWNKVNPLKPTGFIYLRPNINLCMDRIKERNREGENNISIDYQLNLQKKHDDFFNNTEKMINVKTLVLEENRNFRDDNKILDEVVECIITFFKID